MKKYTLLAVFLALAVSPVLTAKGVALKGTYVEARTAEVFTGGCVMNAEAGTSGREALLAWKVDRGSYNGVALNGLAVVAAVAGDANLGIREIGGETAITRSAVFVDERATPPQRAALLAMAKRLSNGLVDTVVEVTPTAIQFVEDQKAFRVATKTVRLTVEKELTHDPTCGGKQWFHPFSDNVDGAAMGTTAENAFSGTGLGTKWSDPNKRSGFFGTFSF